jgi:outer membrane lipoprotein-sorting protein
MTNRLLTAVMAVCVTVGLTAQTAAPPTVDQILQKSIDAMGGRAALEKITSLTAKGTVSVPDAGVDGTITLFQKAPNKALTIADIGGQQQREAFDGTIGWAEDPQNGLREKAGLELAEARRGAVFGRELVMKTVYPKMTVQGREKLATREAYVVEAVPAEGAPARLYYDVESGLLVRQVVSRQTPAGPIDVDVAFDDYRDVAGVKRPFKITQTTSAFTAVIQLSEVKHNVEIADAMFKKPGRP